MAWLENAVNFIKGGIDDVRILFSGMALDQLDTMSLKLYNNKYNVGSQIELEKAYSNMYDEQFIRRAFDQQIYAAERGKGLFGKEYKNFDFSDMGKNLTEDQRKTLMKEFRADYDKRLEDIYSAYVPMDLSQNAKLNSKGQSTNGKAWFEGDLNFNYGMQKKYINDNVSVLDFATSADSDLRGINKAINKSSHSEELKAYRSYLNERLMNVPSKSGTWKKPDDIYSYFTKKGYNASDAAELKTEYNKLVSKNIASGNPDHSGINIWEKAKKHPVIATSMVMGTAFGISELTEDDSF